ncbi:MAG: iron ABC transporter permease [Clostridiales bacterium]|jgi:iron complex transport system permease protein|nr:iron ABC transporter permease [Clostridiales bacterium]
MASKSEKFSTAEYAVMLLVTITVFVLCICLGSVTVPVSDVFRNIWGSVTGKAASPEDVSRAIIVSVRLPRVLCVSFTGAALSLCGAAMQGILRNPLADGSTLGVSSGASLGAVLAIAFGAQIPWFSGAGTMLMAMLFAFLSLIVILSLARKLDHSLSTNTIILTGIVFSMFINSIISLVIAFAGDRVKTITFWTMGSLANTVYSNALTLLIALFICGIMILSKARELNAFAIGEDNARSVGVDVKRVKLILLIAVSALIGICVSIGGTIGFVGLVTPHMTRMIVGPNHKKLLPASMFFGAVFLMLADLLSRTLLSPVELPVGVVTSFIGAIMFIYIFCKTRKVQ